jgi:hypothetical protein
MRGSTIMSRRTIFRRESRSFRFSVAPHPSTAEAVHAHPAAAFGNIGATPQLQRQGILSSLTVGEQPRLPCGNSLTALAEPAPNLPFTANIDL